MTEEKELIRKRGSFKGRLTLFSNFLKTLTEPSLSPSLAAELQLRIGKIDTLFEQFDEVQLRLECIVDDLDAQLNERVEFESQYYRLVSQAQQLLTSSRDADQLAESIKGSHNSGNNRLVKLPTIQLPKFSGSYDGWLEFHDTFTSLIHSCEEIDDINKFHYLRASLEGSAAVVIQSIGFSASNYDIAWKLLCERFNNKRLLVQNHVSALFNIEPLTRESAVTLKGMIDDLHKNLRALEALGEPVKHWDTLLIHIITQKLDKTTYREWEEWKGRLDKDKPITFDSFLTFLRNRADFIETMELSRSNQFSISAKTNSSKLKTMVSVQNARSTRSCSKCNGEHTLNNCPEFLALSVDKRLQSLQNYKICFNCFRSGHYANQCKREGCKICKRKHHTLIHVAEPIPKPEPNPSSGTDSDQEPETKPPLAMTGNLTLSASVAAGQNEVLLSTALVKLVDAHNREHLARAVLDSGSTSCLMTERMCQRLNLPVNRVDVSVLGINNASSHIGKMCRVPMKSLSETFYTNLQCFILPTITDKVPCRQIDLSNLNIPTDICLADPKFHMPAAIDLIIGADVFWDLLGSQQIKLGVGKPILFETRLGWLVSGPINSGHVASQSQPITCNFTKVDSSKNFYVDDDIQNQLMRFWQLEEVSPKSTQYFPEEKLCEEHFIQNTTRLENGRFCVRIPFKKTPNVLGGSLNRAKHCFMSLERRIKSKPLYNKMYVEFMSEYLLLGHMTECRQIIPENNHFIPHHGVLREDSSTTKLRVVFNASSPTTSGTSFNDIQMVGPTVQDDLLSILLRFRQHKYILAADVEKMYRQIALHPADRRWQQIVWRDTPSEPLRAYQLNTITYGTASAPFLATRCLKQIGLDLECKDPKTAEIIMHDFYVDDLLTGGDDLMEVKRIRDEVTTALAAACMPLRKWKSNEPQLVSEPSPLSLDLNIGAPEPCKTLGLGWVTSTDELCFPVGIAISNDNTKRHILSVISQIFDPLGLLAPCVILMKMLLQKLWLHKIGWDEKLTSDVSKEWAEIFDNLSTLNSIRVPRHVVCESCKIFDLHIFTDASERAYGACLYVRSVNNAGKAMVRLLLAKSRVAPIKPTTIPRLELCGALIGARLYEKTINSLRTQVKTVTFWTDSTIVLGWLKMLPNRLQPFVRNRVAEILEKTASCVWRHVPTHDNPADLISRGTDIKMIQSLDLWWSGPTFLQEDMSCWPLGVSNMENKLPETRPEVVLKNVVSQNVCNQTLIDFARFSSFLRLQRTIAYALRFVNRLRNRHLVVTKYLSKDELKDALNLIVRTCQRESFPEYKLLLDGHKLPKNCSLMKFNPFLDEDNLMRVGGRLLNSNFCYEKKHPLLLQSTHQFTKLLFYSEHKRLLHAGPQLLLASIRDIYWPIGGRNLAKACYHRCVQCTRIRGKSVAPIMGNLPQQRLLPGGYPFDNVGVDYAGPIWSASRQGRGCRLVKVYIAIFVCFTTKAIHLELVGDLTSNNYLLALRRFMARRGKPMSIFSDNGTSFVGAYNDISKFLKDNCDSLSENVANEGVTFHFIPAYTPHFGGLWEAGVKSTKFHLQRVLGNCNLTYEELNTTLVQIEAILNSRPLTPISSEPDDLMPLTPGHFLIGRALVSLPVPDYQDNSKNYLTRFQRIEQLRQHFWARWSKEYVSALQQRIKWRDGGYSLKMNSLVLLKEDNLPPLKWRLGRIVAVHPGADGINRVADVKTANGVVRRAFSKICPLPESE